MDETKLEWSDLKLFLSIARGGGLAGASNSTGVSAPTLGRHMVALEKAVGESLFNRLPRGYELTEAGVELLGEAESVEQQILNIERRRVGANTSLPIQISAGTWTSFFLAKHFEEISLPTTRLVFRATEERHDISRRQATIGIRNSRPLENALAARKTVEVAFASYVANNHKDNLNWISTTAQTPSANWVRANKKAYIKYEVSNPRQVLDFAKAGAGHAVLPCFIGDQEENLVRGEKIDTLSHSQWLVVHGEDRNEPNVRKTIDLIAKLMISNRAQFSGS